MQHGLHGLPSCKEIILHHPLSPFAMLKSCALVPSHTWKPASPTQRVSLV